MTIKIHKFPLDYDSAVTIQGDIRKVLHVALQHSTPTIWVEETIYGKGERPFTSFVVLPTGAEVPKFYEHAGTFLSGGGAFVWHVYMRRVLA